LQLDLAQTSTGPTDEFSVSSLVRDSFGDLTQRSDRKVAFDIQEVVTMGSEEGRAQVLANIA